MPPGIDNASRMTCLTSPSAGIVPLRHSVTRSSSMPTRSANSSHDRPDEFGEPLQPLPEALLEVLKVRVPYPLTCGYSPSSFFCTRPFMRGRPQVRPGVSPFGIL